MKIFQKMFLLVIVICGISTSFVHAADDQEIIIKKWDKITLVADYSST